MFHASRQGLRATPRVSIAVLIGIASALSVAADGRAETVRPERQSVQTQAFHSDRLSVEVVGQGPDVILIPGLISSREVWRSTADRLKATHRVHLIQFAGFAGEPWSHGDGPFIQPEVDELARYIREAGLRKPAIIGHSMGALSGLLLAQQHPELVSRLMSVDSLPFYTAIFNPTATPQTAAPFADQAAAQILSTDDASFARQQAMSAESLSRTPAMRERMAAWAVASDRHAMASALRDVMTTDARPGLAAMITPVTALYAADVDGGSPPALAAAVWAREYAPLPGVILIPVENSRHFIMADQPDRFAELVDAFLR